LKRKYEENYFELQKANITERQQLKKDITKKVTRISRAIHNFINQQMNETAKKSLRENYLLKSELKKLVTTFNEILKENELLKINLTC
jgi:hypothetical protein